MSSLGDFGSWILLAQQGEGPPWWFYPFLALVGLVMIALGVSAIITKRVTLRGRQRWLFGLFGIQEITGVWAVILGGGQCFAGALALLMAITGPFWAGFLAEGGQSSPALAQASDRTHVTEALRASENRASERRDYVAESRSALTTHGPSSSTSGSNQVEPAAGDPPTRAALRAGSDAGQPYTDAAPPGGLLVGMRLAQGQNWGGALHAVQPIYQVGAGYVLGTRHGQVGGEEHQVLARPGYAVGALNARAGLALNAVQVVFYRVNGQRLDPADQYASEWIGSEGGGPYTLDPQGDPITGVFGTWQEDLISIGLEPKEQLDSPIAKATAPPPDLDSEPRAGMMLGRAEGVPFQEIAPDGGVLVGVRAFCDEQPRPTLRSLQPIYLVGDRYLEGQRFGEGGEKAVVSVARPGYCVGGVGFSEFGDAVGLRLTYVKLTPDSLANQATYESPWLGHEFHHPDREAKPSRRVAVGLAGHWDTTVRGVGLILLGAKAVKASAAPVLPPELRKAAYAKPPMRAGGQGGSPFADEAPDGGLLVGLRCFQGRNWGGALQAVQPIYRVGAKAVPGRRHGKPGGVEHELIARPGYAVGAIHARAGLVLNAVQVVFYRIDGPRLDPADHYASEWVGSEGGGPVDLDPQGDPVTGVFGSWQEDLISLGIERTEQIEATPAAAPPADFRTWTSADGNFTLEARLVAVESNQVKLQRRNGTTVTVPLAKLSEADNALLRQTLNER